MLIGGDYNNCGICGNELLELFEWNDFPLAGKFQKEPSNINNYCLDLGVGICNDCGHIQLNKIADPKILYEQDYTYRSTNHFLTDRNQNFFIDYMQSVFDKESPVVMEVGCNDLSLLNALKDMSNHRIGIDPIQNSFYDEKKGLEIHGDYVENINWNDIARKVDIVISRHNVEHILDLNSYFENVHKYTEDDTKFLYEFPDSESMVDNLRFDQIFHQHIHYFSLSSFEKLLSNNGFSLISSIYNKGMWGGSWIVYFEKKNKTIGSVKSDINKDNVLSRYNTFTLKNKVLDSLICNEKEVFGYGAGQMAPILAYHLDSTLSTLECIYDDDKDKDGTYYNYLSPKIINIKNKNILKDKIVVITSVDAMAPIISNISPYKMILPNQVIMS